MQYIYPIHLTDFEGQFRKSNYIITMKFAVLFSAFVTVALAHRSGPYHFDDEQERMDFDSMVQNMCDYEAVGVVCRDPLLNREFVFTPWTDVRSMPHREGLYAIAIEFLEAGGYCQKDIEKAIKKAKANRRKPRRFSGIL